MLLLIVAALSAGETAGAAGRRGVATLASAAVPGTGQLLLGQPVRGEVMLWTDAACWTAWLTASWLSAVRENDARLTAAVHAGADLSIRDLSYYKALERYDNSEEYNEDIRREARERYPDDPDAQRRYYVAHGRFGSEVWDWDSDSSRINLYWRTRKSARAAGLSAQFLVGALLLNRLVSVVDCAFFSREPALSTRLGFELAPGRPGIGMVVRF